MIYDKTILPELAGSIELSTFTIPGGVTECDAMLHIESRGELFQSQYKRLKQVEAHLLQLPEMQGAQIVFKRYFLSDATNQRPLMAEDGDSCTISYIQQPPLDGSKVAVWIYLQKGTEVEHHADRFNSTIVRHNGYEHIWTMGIVDNQGDSYQQTETLLDNYERLLTRYHANLAENCIRTWFFVRDVDTQYNGLVVARRENFTRQGLTAHTHYISSTGIGGKPSDPKAIIQMGCYAMTGFQPKQQRYLYAASHLNKTYEYGVTFERGTLMQYGDRNHAFISGTASINNKGEVMHVGDIVKQTHRMWENVEKLLEEAGMTMENTAQIIVYLRDTADYETVRQLFNQKYPNIPTIITLAPVCRPTWLIEMECIGIKESKNSEYRDF